MKRFKKVYIEITNICNLECEFCPKLNRKLKFMNIEEFEVILKSIKPYTDYIYFHLMGEPLLNPNLEAFFQLAFEYGFKVNITTNGTLLKEKDKILFNAKALRQVNVSLHSFEANNNNRDFNEYFDSVLNFIEVAQKETKIISAMRLWNLDSIENKGANMLNTRIINKISEKFSYNGDIISELEMKPGIKISERVYLNSAEKFSWPNINIDIISEKGFCHGLRDHIGILCDGTVVPCCLDSDGNIPLGNIFDNSLEDILEGDRAKKIYDGFTNRNRVEELCKKCGYSQRF